MEKTPFTPKIITIFREGYKKEDLRHDFLAGLTVAVVALPLALALAIASGASPEKGLVTAIIAGFLISLFGGSRVQIGGPTGAFVVVVFSIISHHGYDGLLLSTILAGFILIIAGYSKLGQVIKYIPMPVITGFTAGIAVIIATTQIRDFLGLQMGQVPADFFQAFKEYIQNSSSLNMASVLIGFLTLGFVFAFRRWAPKAPAYLLAIFFCSLVVFLLHLPVETIGTRFPVISAGLPLPTLPEISLQKVREVLPSAVIVAFLAGIEALLSAMVADGMSGYKHRSNQELVGQGVANIASALFGGLPATGAIARTATNIKAGGRTPLAGIFHSVFVLIFALTASDLMTYVPMATLAAVLFAVAWGMSERETFLRILALKTPDRWVMLLTFILTVFVDLTVAIGVGVTLASLLFMLQMSKSVEISSIRRRATDFLEPENGEEDQRAHLPEGVEVFRIRGPLFFGVAGDLMSLLSRVGEMPRVLILRMRYVPFLDGTGLKTLEQIIKICRTKGTKVIFSGLQSHPRALLSFYEGSDVLFCSDYETALREALPLLTRENPE